MIFKLLIKLFSYNHPHLFILKARCSSMSFCQLLNYLSIMCGGIKIRLKYKISIIVITKSILIILDQVIIIFYTDGCIASGGNVKYLCFNLPKLSFMTSFLNFDICYISIATKISNFLHNIQYLLFKIMSRKISLPKNHNLCT